MISRAAHKAQLAAKNSSASSYTKMFFGSSDAVPASTNSSSTSLAAQNKRLSANMGATGAPAPYTDSSFRWSSTNLSDGYVPRLQWAFGTSATVSATTLSTTTSTVATTLPLTVAATNITASNVTVPAANKLTNPSTNRLQAAVAADNKAAPTVPSQKSSAGSTSTTTKSTGSTSSAAVSGSGSGYQVFAASKKLHRHMRICEAMLQVSELLHTGVKECC